MKFQNTAHLSLGSNRGNRQQQLADCVDYIHNHVATVVKVSGIYSSPAWGFEGDEFYNCAITIHTFKTAHKLLEDLLSAESKAGRVRNGSEGYTARTIDIDIISFNNEVIREEGLTVPHPRMQDRNFVMVPLAEIGPEWHGKAGRYQYRFGTL